MIIRSCSHIKCRECSDGLWLNHWWILIKPSSAISLLSHQQLLSSAGLWGGYMRSSPSSDWVQTMVLDKEDSMCHISPPQQITFPAFNRCSWAVKSLPSASSPLCPTASPKYVSPVGLCNHTHLLKGQVMLRDIYRYTAQTPRLQPDCVQTFSSLGC